MALNPSCNSVTSGTRFPNLGDPPFTEDGLKTAKAELLAAFPDAEISVEKKTRVGFKPGSKAHELSCAGIFVPGSVNQDDLETRELFEMQATWREWSIRRAWYYWVVVTKSTPVPSAIASPFNDRWGSQVRVGGYAGGTGVVGPVSGYHVDTVEGLAALAELLREQTSGVDLP